MISVPLPDDSGDDSDTDPETDECWRYQDVDEPAETSGGLESEDLQEPRVAASKYVPRIEYDSEKRAFRLTRRL